MDEQEGTNMDIRHLREFTVLAAICNFQEAADQLYISQSVLSKHIQLLEKELGVSLFDRNTRKVTLNEFGQSFYIYASQIVQIHSDALGDIARIASEKENKIIIGFLPALDVYGIVNMAARFNQAHPDIAAELVELRTLQMSSEMGRCHFIFASEQDLPRAEYERLVYQRDRLAIVFPENHPLAGEKTVRIEQVRHETFFYHSMKYGHFGTEKELFRELCEKSGFTPNFTETVGFSSSIIRMVAEGLGCTAMFRKQVLPVPGVSIVDIFPEVPLNICIFYKKKQRLSESQRTFLNYVRHIDSCCT